MTAGARPSRQIHAKRGSASANLNRVGVSERTFDQEMRTLIDPKVAEVNNLPRHLVTT
jgi:hypothetical protein